MTASGRAFTASPMIPISRRIAYTAISECSRSQRRPMGIDLGDRSLNVSQSVSCRSAHNAIACRRADSDTRSLRSSAQTTSTGISSNSSSSNRMPDRRESRLPEPSAVRSNSRSTSLSGPAVPCAIDPNSRGLLAPYLASTTRIASRCSRRRSSVRLLYMLVTLPILRLVSDDPSGLATIGHGEPGSALRTLPTSDLAKHPRGHPPQPGSIAAQPCGSRICHRNEKKAVAILMRRRGRPPVGIATRAMSVENLHVCRRRPPRRQGGSSKSVDRSADTSAAAAACAATYLRRARRSAVLVKYPRTGMFGVAWGSAQSPLPGAGESLSRRVFLPDLGAESSAT